MYEKYDGQKITVNAINVCYSQSSVNDVCFIGFRSDDGALFVVDNPTLDRISNDDKELGMKINNTISPSRFEIIGTFSSVLNKEANGNSNNDSEYYVNIPGTTYVGRIQADSLKLIE